MPNGIEFLNKLEDLDLSHNPRMDISKTLKRLQKLPNLKELSLGGCELSKIPKELYLFQHLEHLIIWNNKLTDEANDALRKALPNTNIGTS